MAHYLRSKSDADVTKKLKVIEQFLHSEVPVNPKSNNEEEEKDPYYWPNCDTSIWTRSCEKEVIEPLQGELQGSPPKWLRGTLLRNGPGSLKVGSYEFNHLFDGSAFLHKFEISDGKVTYQNRFVQTNVYKKNHAAGRIVINDFGTQRVPDPCQSIFHRVSSVFKQNDSSDNTMISIYPFGDEFYTFTETPIIHRIDAKTLETMGEVNVSKYVGVVNHTSHPHVMNDGTVYNVGLSISLKGPAYNVIRFSPSTTTVDESGNKKKLSMFDQAEVVATVPSRWILNPSYIHTFGITENYYIIIEQPLAVSLVKSVCSQFRDFPLSHCLKWHEHENTLIQVVSKKTGEVERTFVAEAFFYFHIINQFETCDGDFIVLDVCCYKDSKMIDCMYKDALENIHKNPNYPNLFRGRPLRFVMPMKKPAEDAPIEENLIPADFRMKCSKKILKRAKIKKQINDVFKQTAAAYRLPSGNVFVKPELLSTIGCETPRLNYESYMGKEYRFFYAVCSDVDLENSGVLIKVDTVTKTKKTWCETNVYPSEPIFVPDPSGKNEDDGVVVSSLIWGKERETDIGLLILDAGSFTELARVDFKTASPMPKCLHGWFSMNS